MVPVTSLLLHILGAAVGVFLSSSVIHMLLGYHRSDFRRLPAEGDVMDALRRFNLPPGDYAMPLPEVHGSARSPEFLAKQQKGPNVVMTVWKAGPPNLGSQLGQWFLYCLVVSLFTAYVTGVALPPGADARQVTRIAGTVAFAGYALALAQFSIWYGKSWRATLKSMLDGFAYAFLTALVLAAFWPR